MTLATSKLADGIIDGLSRDVLTIQTTLCVATIISIADRRWIIVCASGAGADAPFRGVKKRELCATKRAMQLIEPMSSVRSWIRSTSCRRKSLRILDINAKKRLRSCRPPIPVMQTAEAGTGDHRGACRRSIFHRAAIRSVFI